VKNSSTRCDFNFSLLKEEEFYTLPIVANKPTYLHLENVSINLRKNAVTCLMGKSGIGKTTLMEYCIKLFIKKNIDVAYHNQGYSLLENKTVIQNIKLIFQLQNKQVSLDKIEEILSDVHLNFHGHKKVYELSEGMKQRLNLAKTLIQNVDVYCLDEPFSAQHYSMRRHLCEVLKKWTVGKTVFLITHQKEDSYSFKGEILHLKEGKLFSTFHTEKFYKDPLILKENNGYSLSITCDKPQQTYGYSKFFAQVFIIILFIVSWYGVINIFQIPTFLIPTPHQVFDTFCAEFQVLTYHFFQTIYPLVCGISFSFFLSIGMAICLFKHRRLTEILDPFFVIIQSIPVFLILPLLLYFTGNGIFPKILILSLNFFFPLLSAALKGLQSLPTAWCLQKQILKPPFLKFLLLIRIYFAKNILWQGFRVSLVHSPLTVLSCDWIGASSGLGYIIMVSYSQLDLPLMIAALLYVVFLCIILNSFAKKIDNSIESST
jgi:ABC-type nitrate/sulfonate/bicarbonate transport system permease component/ABC-type multidrug transport system ATPase subunit